MATDKFGISMLCPSKPNGQEWFMGDDPEDDPRFAGQVDGGNATDGFYTNESDFRYSVLTTKGYKSPDTKEHDKWIERGYISYPEDWRNIEFTIEVKYDGEDDFSLYTRSGRHTGGPGNCEGTKYSVGFNPKGQTRYAKETHHNKGYAFTNWKNMGIGSIDNKWVRVKFLVYDIANGQGATDWVKLETWVDPEFNNGWKKVDEITDTGENFGEGGEQCGTSEQATFRFGGPFTTLRGDASNRTSWRKWSVREINQSVSGELPGGGTGGGGGGGTGTHDCVPPGWLWPDPVQFTKDGQGDDFGIPDSGAPCGHSFWKDNDTEVRKDGNIWEVVVTQDDDEWIWSNFPTEANATAYEQYLRTCIKPQCADTPGGGGGGTGGGGTGTPQIEPGSVGKDKFGISQLNPTPVGGWQYFAPFDTALADTTPTARWFHPTDPYFVVDANPQLTFNFANGIMNIDTIDTVTDIVIRTYSQQDDKRWTNMEATFYMEYLTIRNKTGEIDGADRIGVTSDHHHGVADCPYNAHEYHTWIWRTGEIHFAKETVHGKNDDGSNLIMDGGARPSPEWKQGGNKKWWEAQGNSGKPPLNQWIGFKMIKQLIDGGKNVRLRLLRDFSDGSNGGDWQLLMEYKHVQGNWTDTATNNAVSQLIDQSFEQITTCRIPPSCDCNDPVFNHSGGMCYLRISQIEKMRIKKLSWREIVDGDSPLPDQTQNCQPGYRKNEVGECVPIDGSGGSTGAGDPGIIYKDFTDIYHIGTNDADSCDISGILPDQDLDVIYEVDETDQFYEIYNNFKTHAGIYIASVGSTMINYAGRKFRFFIGKQGFPTGSVGFHVNDSGGKFVYQIGRIEASLLTEDFEEYDFELPDNKTIFQLNWVVWVSFQGGNASNFVKVATKAGNPFDGNATTAIRYGPGSGREQIPDADIAAVIWK